MKKLFAGLLVSASITVVGCSKTEDYESSKIVTSYKEAQSDGYRGSLDDWVGLTTQYQQNPQQAQAVAAQQGYDGSDMLLAGVAGAVAGHMISNNNSNSYDRDHYTKPYQKSKTVVNKTVVVNNYNSPAKTPQSALKPTTPSTPVTTVSNVSKPTAIKSVNTVATPSISIKKSIPLSKPKVVSYTSKSSKSYSARATSRRR